MSDNFEITDEDTGEVFEIPMDGIVGGLRDMLISKRRAAIEATTWSRLSEQDQKEEIIAAGEFARAVVYKLAEAIAEGGRQCAHVSVAKFGVDVDKGELTVACKGYAQDEVLLDLVHSKGKVVKLTVVDPEQFNRRAKPVKADPDQPPLFGEEPEQAEEGGEEQSEEEMAADMDADLDRMEEPDDLHAEPEAADPIEAGRALYWDGAGPDDCPYDGGTESHDKWNEGYKKAKDDHHDLRSEAQAAAKRGAPRKAKGWRAGTRASEIWLEEYDKWMADNAAG